MARRVHRWVFAIALAAGIAGPRAQAAPDERVVVPNFWETRGKPDRPSLGGQRVVRFLTDDDYPPLSFNGPDGTPTGFVVELARAACEVLEIACTVQARRFDTLLDALGDGRGDAIAAAIPTTLDLRRRFVVTAPFYKTPARFIGRIGDAPADTSVAAMAGKTVGIVAGTAHEAFVGAFWPNAVRRSFATRVAAESALRGGDVDLVFDDAMSLSLWLNGSDAAGCCRFVDGPFMAPAYFGEGVGFVLRPQDEALRRALDYALQVLSTRGTYAQLYLRFFPRGFY